MRTFNVLMLAVLTFVLAACGFGLRESRPLAEALLSVSIEAVNPDSLLVADLERELQSAGTTLRPAGASGAAQLRIPTDSAERRVVSLDQRAKVGEYEIVYRVVYEVLDAEGKVLVPQTTLQLARAYAFDEQQAIGAAQEEDMIRSELRRELVRMIMERLARISDPNAAHQKRASAARQ
jgi:LPS-assembly lipoprotein